MEISHIPLDALQPTKLTRPDSSAVPTKITEQFGNFLEAALERTNNAHVGGDEMAQKFMEGADVPIHRVMLELTKADLTMKLATSVTKRVINAYQEIARIHV